MAPLFLPSSRPVLLYSSAGGPIGQGGTWNARLAGERAQPGVSCPVTRLRQVSLFLSPFPSLPTRQADIL